VLPRKVLGSNSWAAETSELGRLPGSSETDGCRGRERIAFGLVKPVCLSLPIVAILVLSCGTHVGFGAAESNAPAALTLSSPADFQVFQRTSRTEGQIIVAGHLPREIEGPATVVLETRLAGAGLRTEPDWRKLATIKPGKKEFHAELTARGGGWFQLQIRIRRDEAILGEVAVEHVGVGEVFVIVGQSNSANHGEEKQQTRTGLVAAFSGTGWTLANDPQPGASGSGGSFMPPFGDALVDRFHIPIGIVAAGVGATSVREWLPKGTQFPNPPTITNHVTELPEGEWESNGDLFDQFVNRLKQLGPHGFRAVLWHQGESDSNQQDATRTLAGPLYEKFLTQLIRDSRREVGWDVPWFVAQASYQNPENNGSPSIRAAQEALWKSGVALEGPDTDALRGDLRDSAGAGVHFSGKGLREHADRWVDKVAPWLDRQLLAAASVPSKMGRTGAPPKLVLPGENFMVSGRPAFVFLPEPSKRTQPQPWIFYAPTLPAYPDEAERWMHEQFLAAGVAVAGVDVGEAYGSPKSHAVFDELFVELTKQRGFAPKLCLFGRSRGGLWVSSWAIANPDRIAGMIGIYPVFDYRTYPGITNAAPAYNLTPAELGARASEFNPIARVSALAKAGVPVTLIHGDVDAVVPLKENSAELARQYEENGAAALVKLIVLKGQGHNFFEGFFHSQELVDFAIARARAGANQ